MKHKFIINPVAGKNNINKLIGMIDELCQTYDLDYDINMTDGMGDAKKLARSFALQGEECVIYSVGGDGTLNEVINGMVQTDAILGVIPTGSGNDFFRMLSNSKENVIDRTLNGTIDHINLGKVNNNYFVNIASIGYDAQVAANVYLMKQKKIIPNKMIYLAGILYTLLSFESPDVKIFLNDMTLEQQITLLAICNGQYYGNGVPISPNANYSDNLFNICLADKISKAKIPFLLADVLKGDHEKYDFVHTYQTDYIKVESKKPLNCNIDGEIIVSDNFEFGIVQGKMRVLKPKK